MGNTSSRAISLKLPPALDRRLTDLAHRRRTTRSAIMREALETFDAGVSPNSVAAAASDLAGCVSGPADLSTAPEHMVGYGR
jgi:predicted transcriptional regulator